MKHQKTTFVALALASLLFVSPVAVRASTLSAPQVSAIIGLLQAFSVDQATIDLVYSQLAPAPQVSTTTVIVAKSAPVQEVATSTPVTVVVEQPISCTLSAEKVVFHQGTTHALFHWRFTDGAIGTINAPLFSGQGSVPTKIGDKSTDSPVESKDPVYGPTVFGSTTYVMTVTKGNQTATCSTDFQGR